MDVSEIRISKKVAQSAALSVINNHRIGNSAVLATTHPEVHQHQRQQSFSEDSSKESGGSSNSVAGSDIGPKITEQNG